MKKQAIGLVIGRFQPFHKGHAYLVHNALQITDKLIIGVGSTNVHDQNNPWRFNQVKKMIRIFLINENLQRKVISIVSIPDHSSDDIWLKEVFKKAGTFDVVIGNNNWVKRIFKNAHIPVVTVKHFKRGLYEGYKIRQLMRQKKKWQDRVPISVRRILQASLHL